MRYSLLSVLVVCVIGVMIPSVFAEVESSSNYGTVKTEKSQYEIEPQWGKSDLSVKIFGSVINSGSCGWVYFEIFNPDGSKDSTQVRCTSDGYYENFIIVDYNDARGTYKVDVTFRDNYVGGLTFEVIEKSAKTTEKNELSSSSTSTSTQSELSANDLSSEISILTSFFPTESDSTNLFNFDDSCPNCGDSTWYHIKSFNPADYENFATKGLNASTLPPPEINLRKMFPGNSLQDGGSIHFLKFKDNTDALEYYEKIAKYMPLTRPKSHGNVFDIEPATYPQKDGFDCKRIDAKWRPYDGAPYIYRSNILCVQEDIVLFIKFSCHCKVQQFGYPNILFKLIVNKVSESDYFPKKSVIVQSEPEPMTIQPEPKSVSTTTTEQTQQPQQQTQQSKGGGCLIATASFGSEMAPQVQFLRELRDNTVLQTESGTSFMAGFNQFYYSFSPAVADYERENPVFKEAVKLTLTPLLTSLTLLQYTDIDSESEMLGYGIGVILLNIGMYFVAPAVLIMAVKKKI